MAGVILDRVSRRFDADHPALDDVSLELRHGELLAVLGRSGSGKTTLLRLIAGFERPDAGEIRIAGESVAGNGRFVPPERRRIGMVFQSYALWPHMDVRRNIGYPLEARGVKGADYDARVSRALEAVGLSAFGGRRPQALSGGQRQRVALARCLVMDPAVVLLDEPLASLDIHLRASLSQELVSFHASTGATMLYVTHDQAEALAIADRVAVLDHGRLLQVDAPQALYREPASAAVAAFVGGGSVVPAEVLGPPAGGVAPVRVLGLVRTLRAHPGQPTGPAEVCLRPEDLAIAAAGAAGWVTQRAYQGATVALDLTCAGERLRAVVPASAATDETEIRLDIRDGWIIPR
ncbi:MAG: ABC transporter ATP-binding protein [Alphaproteobacteria bacterium]|nr:ABC transporter ATP-binding protein [Alphaproteobacteria bacterium]